MKGLLLLAAALGISANAQTLTPYADHAYSKTSPDGKWLVEESNEVVYIYDAVADAGYQYGGMDVMYTVGLGNCANNSGTVVGSVGEKPAYWDAAAKDWLYLPVAEGDDGVGSLANSITPDGKYVCGSMAVGNFASGDEESTFLIPVIWTRGDDGKYGMYEKLPCPKKDFLGHAPQYVTAIGISDDGNTVVGQLVDNTGFYTFAVLYRKGGDGTWTYDIMHPELIYNADKLADLPTEAPVSPEYPNATDFMDEAALALYNQAMADYNQALIDFNNGLIDQYPTFPDEDDFLTGESAEAYAAALAKYAEESDAYWEEYAKYCELLDAVGTGKTFNWNNIMISGNGKYVVSELSEGMMIWGDATLQPVRMEIAGDGSSSVEYFDGVNMLTTMVTNDGMVLAATPAMAYSRSTYVFAEPSAKPVGFADYLKTAAPDAWEWMDKNLRFDITLVEYDPETGEESVSAVSDSLVVGTVRCNSDATLFTSFLYDEWTGSYMLQSYVVDLGGQNGISPVAAAARRPKLTFKGGRLGVDGNVKSVSLYDANGRLLANAAGALLTAGCYVVRMEDSDGNVWTERVAVK